MRVFVTGSTGFIGTELVKELIAAGHKVRGLTRTDAGVEQLKAAGAEAHRGDLQDLNSLRSGAKGMDAVVNLAFDHDWSKFAQNAEDEIKGIEALGSVLGPGKLLVVTSGVGLTSGRRLILPWIRHRFREGPKKRHGLSRRKVCMSRLCVCRRCTTRASRGLCRW